jgi:hypothetical protein
MRRTNSQNLGLANPWHFIILCQANLYPCTHSSPNRRIAAFVSSQLFFFIQLQNFPRCILHR